MIWFDTIISFHVSHDEICFKLGKRHKLCCWKWQSNSLDCVGKLAVKNIQTVGYNGAPELSSYKTIPSQICHKLPTYLLQLVITICLLQPKISQFRNVFKDLKTPKNHFKINSPLVIDFLIQHSDPIILTWICVIVLHCPLQSTNRVMLSRIIFRW